MKLDPRQLRTRLKDGLSPVYLVSGDEPLLVDETLDALRTAAVKHGYTERERHIAERYFDWDDLANGLQSMSLFAERRLIECRLPTGKPGQDGGKFFTALAGDPPPDTVFVVITPKLDKRTMSAKWVKSLLNAGDHIPLYAPSPAELPDWLTARLKAVDLEIDRDALELLSAQVEGNLLAAKQEIDKLALLADQPRVDAELVRRSVADGARFDVFQLGDAALAGNRARVARVLYGLENEGIAAPLVLWSLVRECSALAEIATRMAGGQSAGQAMNQMRIWNTRQGLYRQALKGRKAGFARRLIAAAARADRVVKGSLPGQPWAALMELSMLLAGAEGWQTETAA